MHILHATLCLIIFTIITTIIPRAVGTTADLFIYLFLVPVGEARYSCTVTPSARETTRARSRYGAARFRARRRFSSDGAVIVGCFARAPRREKKKIRSFQCKILSAPDKPEHREIQNESGGRDRTTCAIVAGNNDVLLLLLLIIIIYFKTTQRVVSSLLSSPELSMVLKSRA